MNALLALSWPFSQSVVEQLGWVLIHSLWQFTIVALLAALAARALRRHSAATRYGVFAVAMSVSVAAALATWMLLPGEVFAPVASRVTLDPHPSASDAIDPMAGPEAPNKAAPLANDTESVVPTPNLAPSTITSPAAPGMSLPVPASAQPAVAWSELAKSAIRPWMAWIVAAWGIGVAVCSVRPLLGWHTLRRLRRVGVSPASDEVLAAMRRVSERLGVRRAVGVLQSTVVRVPLVIGYVRPVILLPLSLATSIPAAQLDAILAHELTHVRRHDFVVKLLQTLVETLFFYHPAVWWLSRQIRVEREHCCDDQVVNLLDNRVEYGRALVVIEELRGRNMVLALGATDGPLISRVRRIVGVTPDRTSTCLSARWPVAFVGLVTLGLVVTIALATTEGQPKSDDGKSNDGDNQQDTPSGEQRMAKELELLRGFWAVDSCDSEAATLNVSDWDEQRWRWTIKGQEIVWGREGQQWRLMFKIDPAKTPKQIHLSFLNGPHEGERCLGIYDWVGKDGKDLKIVFQDPGAKVGRPTSVARQAGSQTSQITLRPLPPIDPVKELASFQGTWSWDFSQPWTWPQPIGVGTDSDGRQSEKRWVVEGNQITWIAQDGERVYVNFTIDPFKAPKQIEFTFLNGPLRGKKSIGIYESRDDEDHRELSMTDPGSDVPRPTYISGSSVAKHSMIVIHRVAPPPEQSAAKELKRLQGVWQMTLCDSTTETLGGTQQEVSKWHWTISGDEILWNRQGEVWKLKLAVDPSKRPRKSDLDFVTGPFEIDLTYLTGPFQGSKCGGIYGWGGIDGQSLMIAIQDPGSDAPRPIEFRLEGHIKTGLMILRPSKPSDAERELSALQGTWTLRNFVTGNFNENKDPSSWPVPGGKGPDKSGEGSELRWVVKDHGITWTSRSGEEIKASFKINTTQRPKQIDLTFLSGPDKGETCLGIYQRDDLDENILWLCLADPDSKSDRPQEFSYKWGAGRSLLSFYPFESPAAQSSTEPKSKATVEPDLVPEKREAVIETVAETFLRFEDARAIGTHAKTKYTRLTNDGEEPANRTDLKEGVRVRYEYMTLRRGATKVVILPPGNPKPGGPNGDPPSNESKQDSRKDQPADAANQAQNDLEKELALWEGTWSWDFSQLWTWPQPIGVGTDSRATRKSERRWTVKGNQITWISQEGRRINVNFTIDPTKTPKQIEFTFLNGPLHGKKSIGIYAAKSDEDHRHLCMTDPGSDAPRPTDFSAGTFLKQSIIVIHRVPPPPKPTVAQAIERLQGVWQMTLCDSMTESFGTTQEEAKKWQWTIKGDEIVWSRQNQLWKMKLEVDPTRSPNEIDLTYLDGPYQGKKCQGMYVFGGVDGQGLMISIQDPGSDAPRPTSISMNGGVMTSLIFLRPGKPSDTEREFGSFQGTWTLRNFDTDFASWPLPSGKGPDEYGEGSELRWTVKGNEIAWTSRTGEEIRASFKIDAMKSPKQFDLTFLNGPHKGQTCLGIYQRGDHDPGIYQRGDLLDENNLWLCIADPDSTTARPANFSYKSGEGRSLLSFYPFESPAAQTFDAQPKDGAKLEPGMEERLRWGEPVNGLRAAVAIRPALAEPNVAVEQEIYLVVQNVSDGPIRFSDTTTAPELGKLYLKHDGVPQSATVVDQPTTTEVVLQPREVAYLRMFPSSSEGPSGHTRGALLATILMKNSHQSVVAHLQIKQAPSGAWIGNLVTADTTYATAGSGDPRQALVLRKPALLLPDHWIVNSVGFDNGGKELVTASQQGAATIRRWDVAGRKLVSEIKLLSPKPGLGFQQGSLKLSHECRRVLAITDEFVGVWDATTGELLKQLPAPKVGENDTIHMLDATPDFSTIVGSLGTAYETTAKWYDAHSVVWDGATGAVRRTLIHTNGTRTTAMRLSPDGKWLATTNGYGVKVWDVSNGELVRAIENDNGSRPDDKGAESIYRNHVWSLKFSPDGKVLAIIDGLGLKLVDPQSGKLLQRLEGGYHYSSRPSPPLVFSLDGQRIARLGTGVKEPNGYVIPIWSTQTGQKLFELHTNANDACFSNDGQQLAVGFSDLQFALSVWNLSSDAKDAEPAGPGPHSRQDRVEETGHYRGKTAAEFIDKFTPVWSEPKLGIQYGIAFTRQPAQFRLGERVPLIFFFRNATDKPLKLDMRPDYYGNTPKVLNVKGEAVNLENVALLGDVAHYVETLQPGESVGPFYASFGLGENPLPGKQHWHPFLKSPQRGEYTLTHTVSINVSEAKDGAPVSCETITSDSLSFEIVD